MVRVRYLTGTVARLGALLHVPKEAVDAEKLKADLTVPNGAYWSALSAGVSTNLEPHIELFQETETEFAVPRHYKVEFTKEVKVLDRRPAAAQLGFELSHTIELRDAVQEEASNALTSDLDDKILSLSCGKGKTVVSLHGATEAKRFPLLVVVHTNALMDQWRDQIEKFIRRTDGEPLKVGHIQAGVADWKGCAVAVAMLHSLCLKEYPPEFYNYWRHVIFDEAHRLGANMFSMAASQFACPRWGLSATHQREDKMDKVFKLHLGKVCYQNLEQPLKPKVYFISTGISVNLTRYIFRRGKVNLSKMTTDLADNEQRTQLIQFWVDKAYKDGRTILVLGERLSQLHALYEGCSASSKSLHVGDMDSVERREALKCKVVFATQQLAKEGLDRPAFDTLFILHPFGGEGRLQQSIGRILRIHDEKKEPRVLVFEDNVGIVQALANKMRKHLRSMGFEARNVKGRG
jgi:superfamily II DNA or RNA helicase